MKRVLVTGASGFVGRHTVRALHDRGHEVIPADRTTGQDLTLDRTVRALASEEPDLIIHLASSCSTLGSMNSPVATFRDTVVTAVNVMEIAIRTGAPVIVTSSVKARDGMTPYGAAKQMVEIWVSEYSRSFSVPVVINRPGTIYGPGQEGSLESGWIAWFLRAKREGITITINGDGYQVRDLLHVSDYVELLLKQAAEPTRFLNRTWDVGGGSANVVTVNDVAEYLGLASIHGPDRYGDARAYIGLNDVPGWEPRVFWKESETFHGN